GPRRGRQAVALHVPRPPPAAAASSLTYAQRPPGRGGAWLWVAAAAEQAPLYRVPSVTRGSPATGSRRSPGPQSRACSAAALPRTHRPRVLTRRISSQQSVGPAGSAAGPPFVAPFSENVLCLKI